MAEITTKKKVSQKTTIFVLIAVAIFVMISIIGSIAGYNAYKKATMTEITNLNTFIKDNPSTFIYEYPDETITINIDEIVSISKNATIEVVNVKIKNNKAEFEVIDNSGNKLIDVSDKVAKYVTVMVTNSFKSKEYTIVLISQSDKDNAIYAENVEVEDGLIDLYSSEKDYILPTPTKTYTSSNNVTFNYDFEGWYTTKDFEEGTEIEVVPKGSSGAVQVYAKFKTNSYVEKDGIYYYSMGKYPQTLVGDYSLVKILKKKTATDNIISYNGNEYYKYKPSNVSNVASNGYSTSTYYYFLIEPLVWQILTNSTPTNGNEYMLFSDKIINCTMFFDESSADRYNTIPESIREKLEGTSMWTNFLKALYDPDSLWANSDAKLTLDIMYASDKWFTSDAKSSLKSRKYTAYDLNISELYMSMSIGSATITEHLYCLQYTDLFNDNYGFDSDPLAYDTRRQAQVTDFAMANGAYVFDEIGYDNLSSYFMRGAGSTYDYKDRRFGYVKYTGAVHCYAASNWNVRSGLRPCCKATISID